MAKEVEVRTRFCGEWVGGFEVVETDTDRTGTDRSRDAGVAVRRQSDGMVLPETFAPHDVRPQR
jgi:hypothetical protein